MPDDNKGGAAVLTREFVPEDLRDRPYLKDLLDKPWDKESAGALFKKLDGAESLIGKRPAIPDPKTAKPEELDKFFSTFAEEKPEGYEVPLEKDSKVAPETIKAVQSAFHAAKVNKIQAATFLKVINDYGAKTREAQAKIQAKADAEFDVLSKTMLGAENKPTMERVKALIAEHAPSVAKAAIAKLDDTNLLIMAAVIDSIHKKFAPEDEITRRSSSNSGNNTAAEKRDKARTLIAEIDKMKPMDPKRQEKQNEVNRLYKEIAEAS